MIRESKELLKNQIDAKPVQTTDKFKKAHKRSNSVSITTNSLLKSFVIKNDIKRAEKRRFQDDYQLRHYQMNYRGLNKMALRKKFKK